MTATADVAACPVIPLFPGSDPMADFSAAEIAWIFADDPDRVARIADARFTPILAEERGLRLRRAYEVETAIQDGRAMRVRPLRLVGGDTA